MLALAGAGLVALLGVAHVNPGALSGVRWSAVTPGTSVQPGRVDIGFAQQMMVHHDQALQLAQIARARGLGRLANLADGVMVQQAIEIGQLRGWLQLWEQPLWPASRSMDWMLASAADAERFSDYIARCQRGDGMPGLATQDELNHLRELSGTALEDEFLRLMVRHHQGALPMADYAQGHAATAVVRALAGQMQLEQTEELRRMQMAQSAADTTRR